MNIPLAITIAAALLLLTLQSAANSPAGDGRGTLVVVNQAEHNVSLVEPPLSRVFATISVGVERARSSRLARWPFCLRADLRQLRSGQTGNGRFHD